MTQTFRHFVADRVDDITTIEFTDAVIMDEDAIFEMQESLLRLIERDRRVKLLLNFSRVQIMSSTGLAILILLDKKVFQVCGRLALCHLGPQITKILAFAKLEDHFEIFPTEQVALERF